MTKKGKKTKRYTGPIFMMVELMLIVMIVSMILSVLGIGGQRTAIVNGVLETSLVTVKNIFSREGIQYLFTNLVTNLQVFEPLILLIVALIGIGIGEASGFFQYLFEPFKRIKPKMVTFLTLLIAIIFTVVGEHSYAILIPLAAVFYKRIGRNPWVGILTTFIGISIGYGAGIIFDYDSYLLGTLTQLAARVDVDKNYTYQLISNLYMIVTSTVVLSFIGATVIEKVLIPKLPKYRKPEAIEEWVPSQKGFRLSVVTFVVIILGIVYMIIPGLPFSGMLLDLDQKTYLAQLFGKNAPFYSSFVFLISFIMMVCSYVYGKIAGTTKTSYDYSLGLSRAFEATGMVFVLMFFASQMIGVLEWTNLGEVVATRIVDFISAIQISGLPLIVLTFLGIIIMSILIPATLTKWEISSPLLVPLFMRANITPNFAQTVFRAADGIGKSITPFFAYFAVLLGFLDKYNYQENSKVTVFGTIKLMLPTILIMMGVWLLILVGWYIVGLPMGPHMYPTL